MDQTISFEIKGDALAVIQSLDIEANFAEMEAALTEMMAPYKSMVLTDMSAAKSARAYVNKVAKSIDDSRKMVKKLYQAPLAAFEERCKKLTGICSDAASAIDAQIKAEEQKERELRINALRNAFDSSVHGLEDYISFDRIYNPKWETKSYGTDRALDDICAAIDRARADIDAIQAMHSPFESALLAEYAQSGDLSRVLAVKAAAERRDAAKAEERQEQEKKAVEAIGDSGHAETLPAEEKRETGPKTYRFTLTFEATREQAFMIDDFFKKNNIRFWKER